MCLIEFNSCILAGYNNVDVAEFLLENDADVNAQDKGGLIPLHNASSYGVISTTLIMLLLIIGCIMCCVHNISHCKYVDVWFSENSQLLTLSVIHLKSDVSKFGIERFK